MSMSVVFFSFLLFVPSCLSDSHLDAKYDFKRNLHSRYTLYWSYNSTLRSISFAVRVQTTGWVGFGLSPNGDMTGSDVVIGWVQNGVTSFNDRFASARATPSIDDHQDWTLINSEEENGFTILEFTRNYTSCDPNNQDRNITEGTSRIVWSFKEEDPVDGVLTRHDQRGSASINLFGGLRNITSDPPGTQSFSLTVNQVTIPSSDTTYWCAGFELPQIIQDEEKYIIRFSPIVTDGNTAHVHHMLVYLCDELNTTDPGGHCDNVSRGLYSCLGETLFAAWAVGGEDFVYPSDTAYALGGNAYRYALIQMHYDNPRRLSGVVDSSGMTFYYIDTPRQHDAGLLQVGHAIVPWMVIPPKATNYTLYGICSTECTMNFPPEGIRVFSNTLHTHQLGVSAKLHHLRRNNQTCKIGNGMEELKPIDDNPNYDFNFQETVHIEEVIIRPGDMLLLSCTYDSSRLNTVTLGGESTREEMCLSFLGYYPRVNFSICQSISLRYNFNTFKTNYVDARDQANFSTVYTTYDPSSQVVANAFNLLNWTQQQIQGLEDTVKNGQHRAYCYGPDGYIEYNLATAPPINCPYSPPSVMLECPDSITPSGTDSTYALTVVTVLISMIIALLFY